MIIPRAMQQRFWAKIDVRRHDECWPWTASYGTGGYGQFGMFAVTGEQRPINACHVALELAGHPRPTGGYALHSCDNRKCCNPRHLRWGTAKDNIHDMLARGRGRYTPLRGTLNGSAKLTEQQAREIKASRAKLNDLCRTYGVSRSTVEGIRYGTRWKHI